MKLWMVIYIAGHIGGAVGPLPYGLSECKERAVTEEKILNPNVTTPQGYSAADVKFVCEFHEARPENDLAEEERAKGFVRPVRHSYKHLKCGGITTMGQTLAETYARQPDFYSGTFCCHCGTHFPVGANGEFVWQGTNEKVGT